MESLIALTALADHTIQPVKALHIPTIRWGLLANRPSSRTLRNCPHLPPSSAYAVAEYPVTPTPVIVPLCPSMIGMAVLVSLEGSMTHFERDHGRLQVGSWSSPPHIRYNLRN